MTIKDFGETTVYGAFPEPANYIKAEEIPHGDVPIKSAVTPPKLRTVPTSKIQGKVDLIYPPWEINVLETTGTD